MVKVRLNFPGDFLRNRTPGIPYLLIDVKYVRFSSTIMQNIVMTSSDQGYCNLPRIKYRTFEYIVKWIKHHMDKFGRDLTALDVIPPDKYEQEIFTEVKNKRLLFDMALSAKRLNMNALYKSCCKAIVQIYPSSKTKISLIFRRTLIFVDIKYLSCSTTIMNHIVAEKQCELYPLRFDTFECILNWIRHHVDTHGRDLTALDEVPFDDFERSHLLEANNNGKLFDVALSANWLNIQPLYKSCCKAIPLAYPGNTEDECLQGLVAREPDTD